MYRKTPRLCNYKKSALRPVETLFAAVNSVDIDKFRRRAFYPEVPLLLSSETNNTEPTPHYTSLPVAQKWFTNSVSTSGKCSFILSREYLRPHAATILPYEIMCPPYKSLTELFRAGQETNSFSEGAEKFHLFKAPLALILNSRIEGLYIVQAPLTDLPPQLRNDFSTPRVVAEAGKGDIYNANIWIGNPPTYTPLHKDPNPNLFVQLTGIKKIRLFEPNVGLEIFKKARRNIGQQEHSGVIRGIEMMEGSERKELEKIVWSSKENFPWDGMEVTVKSGDSLFIPTGWWHSIKGLKEAEADEVVASVNWWFR
ncbi:Lysine-specific demethylase JMJ30 [Erysiphe neolycopersici]|uniref:Lysine-specific demethylase JMJ30 n=1 Tax=Erysiphe neolycopersici TaxID=212602 RepID=A0A420HUD6_9PEZI|nr:Lysine-specific demethylase JMJ30 [Erysiphe neolycopersici]